MLGNNVAYKFDNVEQAQLWAFMIHGVPRKFIRIQLTKTFLIPQPKVLSDQ